MAVVLASALGTIYPQGQEYSGPGRYLQLGDVYHSWWYITLLSLLVINLIACNISRIQPMFNSLINYRSLLEADRVVKLKLHTSFLQDGDIDKVRRVIATILGQHGYEVWSEAGQSCIKIGAQKGRFYTLGSFITHLSFVIILLGALYGGFLGFKGTIEVPVGSTFSLSQVPGITNSSAFNDFSIRVEKFWVEKYASGVPSGYFSRLTIIEKDKPIKTTTIAVNHPLAHRGVKFYQTSYGQLARIKVYQHEGGKIRQELANEGDILKVAGTDYHVLIYRFDPSSGIYSKSRTKDYHIIYAIYKGHDLLTTGKAPINQAINIDDKGNSFRFTGFVPTTGLQVKKDPGVPVVIAGSLLILLGIGMIAVLKPCKIWAVLEQQGTAVNITMGGNSRKSGLAFEEEFEHLVTDLKRFGEEG